jgi:serine/threonine protein kinase
MTTRHIDVETAPLDTALNTALNTALDTAPLDLQPQPEPDAEPGGWVLDGRYRVSGLLGQGGVAEVFKARDMHLGRDVAVKVFRSTVDAIGGAELRDAELKALARLSHPNLVTLFDASVGEGSDPEYLVMELVDGVSLAHALARGPMTDAQVRELGAQIAGALAYVHAAGVVHRDVKPGNILLGGDGTGGMRARLSDFGIAQFIGGQQLPEDGVTVGTAAYVAPEHVRGEETGPAADVYSLGLVLIEALTGRRCFAGPPAEAAIARLMSSPCIPPGLADPWPELLAAMTAADPGARPSAADVADALRVRAAPDLLLPGPLASAAPPAERAIAEPVATTAELLVLAYGDADADDDAVPAPRRPAVGSMLLASLVAFLVVGVVGYSLAMTGHTSRRVPTPAPSAPHSRTHHVVPASRPVPARSTAQVIVRHPSKRPLSASSSTSSATSSTTTPPPSTSSTPSPAASSSNPATASSSPPPSPSTSETSTPALAPSTSPPPS